MRQDQCPTTLEEAWQLTGQLIAEGSATPCSFSALNMNGRINFYIDVPVSAIENISSSVRSTEKLDNPDFIRSLRPLVGPTRRAINPADWPMIIAWCKGYGIDPTNVYMIDEVAMKVGGTSRNPNLTKFLDILKKVQTSDLKVYKETICDLIMDDTCFVSEQYFESAKKPTRINFPAYLIANSR